MNEGAIALIDCLGFKGIWSRADPDNVLGQFRKIRERALNSSDQGILAVHQQLGSRLRISFLSDTVAVGADVPNAMDLPPHEKGRLIQLACMVAHRIAIDFLHMSPPLAIRGCVSYGRFEMDEQFLIGPAVDEAAELHEMADGAFLWIPPQYVPLIESMRRNSLKMLSERPLEPQHVIQLLRDSAISFSGNAEAAATEQGLINLPAAGQAEYLALFKDMISNPANDWNMIPYPVPLKGRGHLHCLVIGPSAPYVQFADLRNQYLSAMPGSTVEILIKRQNTIRFIDYANQKHVTADAMFAERKSNFRKRWFGK